MPRIKQEEMKRKVWFLELNFTGVDFSQLISIRFKRGCKNR